MLSGVVLLVVHLPGTGAVTSAVPGDVGVAQPRLRYGAEARALVEWRATARILADPALTSQLTRRLPDEDTEQ